MGNLSQSVPCSCSPRRILDDRYYQRRGLTIMIYSTKQLAIEAAEAAAVTTQCDWVVHAFRGTVYYIQPALADYFGQQEVYDTMKYDHLRQVTPL